MSTGIPVLAGTWQQGRRNKRNYQTPRVRSALSRERGRTLGRSRSDESGESLDATLGLETVH